MTDLYYPLRSLAVGNWFKLICGASFQHLPAVRNLTLAYALAGADCVDVAADPAVISAARDALHVAETLRPVAQAKGFSACRHPFLMVSLNDGEDPHFRKAVFNPTICPADCSRPCEKICPADAIVFNSQAGVTENELTRGNGFSGINGFSGVIDQRCYGCGRCLPVCPIQQISTRSYVFTPMAMAPLVLSGVDAVEIHTQVGRLDDFQRLWRAIEPQLPHLKLVAISCPDGDGLIDYLWSLADLILPLPCALIWQTDGRPMSGDIGDGATRAAVKLGQKVLSAGLPGYIQLAGGTNRHTVEKLKVGGLLNHGSGLQFNPVNLTSSVDSLPNRYIAGVAYGSYARALLAPVLEQLEQHPLMVAVGQRGDALSSASLHLEENGDLLWQAVHLAASLVSPLKESICV